MREILASIWRGARVLVPVIVVVGIILGIGAFLAGAMHSAFGSIALVPLLVLLFVAPTLHIFYLCGSDPHIQRYLKEKDDHTKGENQ